MEKWGLQPITFKNFEDGLGQSYARAETAVRGLFREVLLAHGQRVFEITGSVANAIEVDLVRCIVNQKRPALFRGRHFEDAIILLCVPWYLCSDWQAEAERVTAPRQARRRRRRHRLYP